MKLTVKYFASIREAAGIGEEVVDLPDTSISLDALRTLLASRSVRMAEALSREKVVRTAVDLELQSGSVTLRDGAEVAFFPPVTGG